MKKNGFTLVELLAVIVVLAALIVLAVPNVMKIVNKQEQKLTDQAMKNLGDAAVSYTLENIFLTKCADGFEPTSVNSTSNNRCTIKLSVKTIVESDFFDDKKASCDEDKFVLVYRYINTKDGNDIDEFRYFMEPDTCYVK
ncbi:MAG: type II secretion system protein [Bacilli bacterium]